MHFNFHLEISIIESIRLINFRFDHLHFLKHPQAVILIFHIILTLYKFDLMLAQFYIIKDIIDFVQLKILELFRSYSFFLPKFLHNKGYNQCFNIICY
jgi:hypothetical protein